MHEHTYNVHAHIGGKYNMETMKAVIYEDVGKFSVKQVPVPKVEKGTDLLLRVDACSICGTYSFYSTRSGCKERYCIRS